MNKGILEISTFFFNFMTSQNKQNFISNNFGNTRLQTNLNNFIKNILIFIFLKYILMLSRFSYILQY